MTNFQAEIDSVFGIEKFDIQLLRTEILDSDGIDIQALYCLGTGKIIGTLDESELAFAIEQCGITDRESLVDDLIVRVVGSMRPSPAWNKPDQFLLQDMARLRPVDCLAWLVNRLNSNRHTLSQRGEHSFQPLLNRIATHNRLTDLVAGGFDVVPWTHWLLELDAKLNLHDIAPPVFAIDKKGNWSQSAQGVSIFQILDNDSTAQLLKVFEKWAFANLADYDKRNEKLLLESTWVRGNTFAKPAFVKSWMDNPIVATRKGQVAANVKLANRIGAAKPKTLTQLKLDSIVTNFQAELDAAFSATLPPEMPKPIKPMALKFTGFKLKSKAVES